MEGELGKVELSAVVGLTQPLIAGVAVNHALGRAAITGPVVGLIGIFLCQAVIDTLGRYLLETLGEHVVYDIRINMVRRLLWARVSSIDRARIGDLLSRVSLDSTVLRDVIAGNLVQAVSASIALVGTICFMIYIDWVLFAIVLGTLVLAILALTAVLSKVEAAAAQNQEYVGLLSADLEQALGAIRTVKVNGAEEREYQHLAESAGYALRAGVRTAKLISLASPTMHVAATGSFVVALVVGGLRVASGAISLSQLVTILLFATSVVMPVGDVYEAVAGLRKATVPCDASIRPCRRRSRIWGHSAEPEKSIRESLPTVTTRRWSSGTCTSPMPTIVKFSMACPLLFRLTDTLRWLGLPEPASPPSSR
jgi:ATP-binding cassette subfamily B protein